MPEVLHHILWAGPRGLLEQNALASTCGSAVGIRDRRMSLRITSSCLTLRSSPEPTAPHIFWAVLRIRLAAMTF